MFGEEIKKSLEKILPKLGIEEVEVELEHPAELAHGDYATNVALIGAKKLGKKPQALAVEIVEAWEKAGLPEFIQKLEVAGPGFINLWLKPEALTSLLKKVLTQGDQYGSSKAGEGKTMVLDYSAPNIAKPFGIGHLRSTNIGQAIYNLYQFLGWKTIGDNHLGDWGTQFGSLIYQIKRYQKKEIEKLTIADLEKLYVEFYKEAEKDPSLAEKAREWFRRLEEGDREAKEVWKKIVKISLEEFSRIYKLLGVKIDYALGESFYLDKMEAVLAEAKKKGIVKESQGALVVEIPGMETPAMLVKSDGATTYLLRDLATIKYRNDTWSPDLIIYEVGADQKLHFQQVFRVAQMLGYGKAESFVHVAHGLIRWPTGKFSTRRGLTIHLEEVLREAIAGAKKLMKTAGISRELPESEREKISQEIGIGAIKYNDLKQNPRTDIIFDWEQILSLSGNSGPYLQYTFARTQSVLRKAPSFVPPTRRASQGKQNGNETMKQLSNEEAVLLRTIYRFPEVIGEAAENFSPNLLCNFLFDLAQKFNLLYDRRKIIGSSNQEFRLLITAVTGQVLKNGLTLLGIGAPKRM